jgi:hypothetical protein
MTLLTAGMPSAPAVANGASIRTLHNQGNANRVAATNRLWHDRKSPDRAGTKPYRSTNDVGAVKPLQSGPGHT